MSTKINIRIRALPLGLLVSAEANNNYYNIDNDFNNVIGTSIMLTVPLDM